MRTELLIHLIESGLERDPDKFREMVILIANEVGATNPKLAERLKSLLDKYQPAVLENPFFQAVFPKTKLNDLVLDDHIVKSIRELVEEYGRAHLLRPYNLLPRHRLLLTGPPGNGKTTLAEALACELSLPLYVVKNDKMISQYLGESTSRLGQVFDEVSCIRCVLFFDEFDALARSRDDKDEHPDVKRNMSNLLVRLDTLPSHVVLVAATNLPEVLDVAVWRRFHLSLSLEPPTSRQQQVFIQRFEERTGIQLPNHDIILKHFSGLSYAEMEEFFLDITRRRLLTQDEIHTIVNERLLAINKRHKRPVQNVLAMVRG